MFSPEIRNSNDRKTHHQYIIGGSSNRPKYTTRHLAALEFLLNIPMKNEANIRRKGVDHALKGNEENPGPHMEEADIAEMNLEGISSKNDDLIDSAGKKLRGPLVQQNGHPAYFRYNFTRLGDSAVVRQWEEQILGSSITTGYKTRDHIASSSIPILSCRVFFSRAKSYPVMVHSIIKYDAGEEKAKTEKLKGMDHKGLEVFNIELRDWRGFSYKPLFKPMVAEEQDRHEYSSSELYCMDRGYMYEPSLLDDPDMRHGSHRYVLQRSTTTVPIMCSIILFVNKQELKQSLNEQFRERHPSLPPSLTLSRIRNVKKTALLYCLSVGIEVSTVAIASINFERLCLKNLVTKANRKLSMAASLILAYKFNECNSFSNEYLRKLKDLMDFFDRDWHLSKRQVFDAEFGAYVHLGFSLHIPYQHIHLVFTQLLKLVNLQGRQYLGEGMYETYVRDVLDLSRALAETAGEVERSGKDGGLD